jgi:hypothetical protein
MVGTEVDSPDEASSEGVPTDEAMEESSAIESAIWEELGTISIFGSSNHFQTIAIYNSDSR